MAKFQNPLVPEKKVREATYNFTAGQLHEMSKRSVLDGMAAGTYITNAMYSAVMLLVLHDTFGFGRKRLQRIHLRVQKYFGEILERRIAYTDLAQVIRDELGINLVVEKTDGVKQSALDLFAELETRSKIDMVFDR